MALPKPGTYYFPWEVSAGQVPDGGALRTFGRLCLYDMTQSRVTLAAQHGPEQHQILVCTKLVEPFRAQPGSLYIVLGELEHQEGIDWGGHKESPQLQEIEEGEAAEQAVRGGRICDVLSKMEKGRGRA
ncbi:PREDICTED: CST complex subunit TEN1 isoform X1 [Miniopterus natalensis]|uniref:CST complex subunit TEN1 isoform X1 n=1 Tax=Miniopterus natalensis TaxID=291302 RepID=UPI0007A6EC58|nr:PREDICTED: CST complex subunit TEN1 isoform X1 [Miniopterus natalensis]